MVLTERLRADLKEAMLSRQSETTGVLRMLISTLKYAEIEAGHPLSDEEVIKVIRKEVKKREEAVMLYEGSDHAEAAASEKAEAAILAPYLPPSVDDATLDAFLENEIKALNVPFEARLKGVLIKSAIERFGDAVDGRQVATALDRITK